MNDIRLGAVEARFADIIWDNEPLTSRRLTELAEAALGWNRSTTYTILRRLCQRGIFQNEGGTVTSVLTRAEFQSAQTEQFVADTFSGSLPAFLAAFARRKKLSDRELDELQRLIDESRG